MDTKRLAVVTGGAGAIAFATAAALQRGGWSLLLCDLDDTRTAEAAARLSRGGTVVDHLAGDVRDPGFAARLLAKLNGRPIGALVAAAGLSSAVADAETILHVNFEATASFVEAMLPGLADPSCVVVLASVTAHMLPRTPALDEVLARCRFGLGADELLPHAGTAAAAYSLSKLALLRLVEHEARRFGERGARFVAVSPGFIDAGMGSATAMGDRASWLDEVFSRMAIARKGEADEIAETIAFLCSDAASYVTGCEIRVDGGFVPAFRNS